QTDERAVQAVHDDGLGNVDAMEPREAGTKIEIAVFVDAEEVLVEKADVVQHGAPKDHTASGRAEDVGGLQENPVGSVAVATFVRNSCDRHSVTGAVECPGGEDHPGRSESDTFVLGDSLVKGGKPAGIGRRV